ncbi:pyridoxal 5'-phosphate synthase-like subunit PDX1.2 [Syzygium oleosum]|uniref:pyridoxal 5'-phosphate synthase-like subunit PDX1.2 n=1 Tax=Syzygium oleosum TaxID=219896 RepID=UPI0024BB04E4|nr:pyridoxal 5'-phosphate synthase-like subunit PDX1.2 [Syzygium oleosum]
MEVRNLQEAILAESAGACCVLVATHSPAGGRCIPFNGLIEEIKGHLSIPVMVRTHVGHTKEAEALVSIGCQFLDNSELLKVANEDYFLNKHELGIPCCCGCQNLGEALKRVGEGAAIIRIQGETSRSGDISKTVKNMRSVS